MTWPVPTSKSATIRAGDDDRENALDLLRGHWMAGRLTLAEYEDRCDEVGQARFLADLEAAVRELPTPPPPPPPPPPYVAPTSNGAAITACVLGITSLVMLWFSIGFLAIVTLPMSIAAWAVGRRARRHGGPYLRGLATAGEVTGIIGALMSAALLSACGIFLSSL